MSARVRGAEPAGRIRTEEARALRWDHVVRWVDDQAGWQPVTVVGFGPGGAGDGRYAIYVWRAELQGGDTKTERSRRTLGLPRRCVEALRQHWKMQAREVYRHEIRPALTHGAEVMDKIFG